MMWPTHLEKPSKPDQLHYCPLLLWALGSNTDNNLYDLSLERRVRKKWTLFYLFFIGTQIQGLTCPKDPLCLIRRVLEGPGG